MNNIAALNIILLSIEGAYKCTCVMGGDLDAFTSIGIFSNPEE